MNASAELHMAYKLANAPVLPFPFPHMLVHDVFPPDFYRAMRAHLPAKDAMKSLTALGRVYGPPPETRLVLPLTAEHLGQLAAPQRAFWSEMALWLLSNAFADLMLGKFHDVVGARPDMSNARLRIEAMLVQDYTTYALGPHTDSKAKVMSLLFYLPADGARPHLGTSLYIPKDGSFRCPGGPHHSFEPFERVYTMPYLPNTLFAFPKNDHCFHAVERITDADVRRDLLLYDIMIDQSQPPSPPVTTASGPKP